MDVITCGEAMTMFVAQEQGALEAVGHFVKRTAGAELNVATGLARLGLRVGWISRVGADSFGRFVIDAVRRENIDASHVTVDASRSTGFMLKSRPAPGEDPLVEYFRKGSAASTLSLADYDPSYVRGARHLHLTGVGPALSPSSCELAFHLAQEMRAGGGTVSFDPNLRPTLWPTREAMIDTLNRLARLADWVLPGLGEGRILTGATTPEDIAAFYLAQGARAVVIKLGPDGAYFASAAQHGTVAAVPVETVVDTVGAGDGFAVGVISALLEGRPLPDAVARGNWIGAQAIQVLGDSEGLPSRAALDAMEQRKAVHGA
jgi:2-dehydro-3-deoxygluconokinase